MITHKNVEEIIGKNIQDKIDQSKYLFYQSIENGESKDQGMYVALVVDRKHRVEHDYKSINELIGEPDDCVLERVFINDIETLKEFKNTLVEKYSK